VQKLVQFWTHRLSVVNWESFWVSYPPKAQLSVVNEQCPVRLNHRKSEFPEKNAFGKNQFSQPWNVRFARSNSRSTTTDHKISNGAIRFGFGVREASQIFPTRLGIILSKMLVRF
jgi:hypothetical protein